MILGWIMIALFFSGIFWVIAYDRGWKTALGVFAAAIASTVFIVVGVILATGALTL